jgi:chromate reductase
MITPVDATAPVDGRRPLDLVAIVGSLRAESSNRAVFDTARELALPLAAIREIPLRDVPMYDGDVEAAGDPLAVVELRTAVDQADGLLIFTPEYNRGVPAVTKNAIDWLSRYPGDSALSRAKVGIVAATPGPHPAAGVRDHLATSVGANTSGLYEQSLGIGSVMKVLDGGRIVDDGVRAELSEWLRGFVNHVGAPDSA